MNPVKLYASLLDSEEFEDESRLKIFIFLLLKAKQRASKYKGITVKRGQVVVSRGDIVKGTGLTDQVVRTRMKRMRDSETISWDVYGLKGEQFIVITILNFIERQKDAPKETTVTKYTSSRRNLGANAYSEDFDEWWKTIMTGSKKEAWVEWQLLGKDLPDLDALKNYTAQYIAYCNAIERSVIDACRYLKRSMWETKWGDGGKVAVGESSNQKQYTEIDRMKDWIRGADKFSQWHGVSIDDYTLQVARDLCDLSDDDFWDKYKVMKSTARETKEMR